MNTTTLSNHYARLSPEERFSLILTAGTRGDEAEQDRLTRAGKRIALSFHDHSPFAFAFRELATATFIDLQEDAARYTDAAERVADALVTYLSDSNYKDSERVEGNRVALVRIRDIANATGFFLRIRAAGWKQFCERLNVPAMVLWLNHPGSDRLQAAIKLADKDAFGPAEMVRWLNEARPAEKPELSEADILSIEKCANDLDLMFRDRVQWWGG